MTAAQQPPGGNEPPGEQPDQGQGYPPPQQGNYPPPQQGNYPPPQQGNYPPPQQGGYPPPYQGGYPPPQGYPPQGYPPQQGGYPPQQGYQQPGPDPLASVGARIGGALIDILVLLIPAAILSALTDGLSTDDGLEISLTGVPFLADLLLNVAYFAVMEATVGATVGKLAVGTRVVKEDFSKIDFGPALIRNLLRIVDYFFCFLIGLIMIAANPKRQRLGDIAANTLVVRKEYART